MKTSSPRNARRPLSRAQAWTYLLLNALVCPGLGSVLGRRWGGLPQLALAWGGALWMMVPLSQYFMEWARHLAERPEWFDYFKAGLGGLAFFLTGWAWSILTGIGLVRQAQKDELNPEALPPRTSGP